MKNLDERSVYWGERTAESCMGDSTILPCPDDWREYFKGKRVLEIGPGGGRQTRIVQPLAKSYAIADISLDVLKLHGGMDKYLIEDYDSPLKSLSKLKKSTAKFDVIHFWYVLHHVLEEELVPFAKFLFKLLNKNGLVMFNTPINDYPDEVYANNGILTVRHSLEDIRRSLYPYFTITDTLVVKEKSTDFSILATRK
jgi:2-polyprenyl-3-methyl-5-hydroxy-6-metoxy-1,4-benzoquinol methylase